MRTGIEKAAIEAIGKKKRIRNRSEELQADINEAYIELLQKTIQQARDMYIFKRNYSNQLTRKLTKIPGIHVEHDVFGRQ